LNDNNWIIDNLEFAIEAWNNTLNTIWQLLTAHPSEFRQGAVWRTMLSVNGALQSIGFALLVLFFLIGVVKTSGSFAEVKKPEHALKLFVRFVLAKAAISYGMDLLMALFSIVQGAIHAVVNVSGLSAASPAELPDEIRSAVNEVGFFASIPLWAVSLIGCLVIIALTFIVLLTVYGRFFKLFIYVAIAPIPLASFGGEPSSSIGKSFLKSYAAVCIEGIIIVISCVIFTLMASVSPLPATGSAEAIPLMWSYIMQLVFNMLILVGTVRMADRVVREMMGLYG